MFEDKDTFILWCNIIRTAVHQHKFQEEGEPRPRGNQFVFYPDSGVEIDDFIDAGMLLYVSDGVSKNDRKYEIFKIRDAKMIKITNHPEYPNFIKAFNSITGKKAKGDKKSKGKFGEAYEKYGMDDILKALRVAVKQEFHVTNGLMYLTPEYILRDYILDRYLTMRPTTQSQTPQFSGN